MTDIKKNQRALIRPERVRKIDGGFAFVPHRFLHDGFLAALTPNEIELYFFLVLAGDRQGLSFYHYDRICSLLQMDLDAFIEARNRLIDQELVAFDGTRFQVLSLPQSPVAKNSLRAAASEDLRRRDGATIRQEILRSLRQPLPEKDEETEDDDA
jgi:hypothetical protein